jgi:hypothetical protein
MSIAPYVRFVWILSLGVMDISLVLVLIFWPERDFMCRFDLSSSSVVMEKDIIATIAVILGLHTGDVVLIPAISQPQNEHSAFFSVVQRKIAQSTQSLSPLLV